MRRCSTRDDCERTIWIYLHIRFWNRCKISCPHSKKKHDSVSREWFGWFLPSPPTSSKSSHRLQFDWFFWPSLWVYFTRPPPSFPLKLPVSLIESKDCFGWFLTPPTLSNILPAVGIFAEFSPPLSVPDPYPVPPTWSNILPAVSIFAEFSFPPPLPLPDRIYCRRWVFLLSFPRRVCRARPWSDRSCWRCHPRIPSVYPDPCPV